MFNRILIERNPLTHHIGRYPWGCLAEAGDELLLYGPTLNASGAVQSIRLYAKRRGFKVSGRKLGFSKDGWGVYVTRL